MPFIYNCEGIDQNVYRHLHYAQAGHDGDLSLYCPNCNRQSGTGWSCSLFPDSDWKNMYLVDESTFSSYLAVETMSWDNMLRPHVDPQQLQSTVCSEYLDQMLHLTLSDDHKSSSRAWYHNPPTSRTTIHTYSATIYRAPRWGHAKVYWYRRRRALSELVQPSVGLFKRQVFPLVITLKMWLTKLQITSSNGHL